MVRDMYVYQDNESAILLETNGMKSIGKGSRYIDIKYFFVTDKLKGSKSNIMHCPRDNMIVDFYIKPLQGSVFIRHRNSIPGIREKGTPLYMEYYDTYMASIREECNFRKHKLHC